MKKNIKINNILILDCYIDIIKQTLSTPLNVIWYGNWTAPVELLQGLFFTTLDVRAALMLTSVIKYIRQF